MSQRIEENRFYIHIGATLLYVPTYISVLFFMMLSDNNYGLGATLQHISIVFCFVFVPILLYSSWCFQTRTTDTEWRHKSKKSEILGRCSRQNMLWPYLKIWEWELFFGRAVKAISSPGVRSPWLESWNFKFNFCIFQTWDCGG